MQKLNDINEAISYLRDGDIITSTGKDQLVFKNNKVYIYNQGNHFGLEIKDFMELYKKTVFYLYEDAITIDEEKDEAYYRYYKK